jgi:hypothetical protein
LALLKPWGIKKIIEVNKNIAYNKIFIGHPKIGSRNAKKYGVFTISIPRAKGI